METELIEKPSLDLEVKAEIKSLGMIEDNISEVKEKVIKLNEYYKNVVFTEETMKQATEEKANVNKFKKAVADYRKNIIAEYKRPIEVFENTAKETEKLLADTYNTINMQVENYNNQKKEKIKEETKAYFDEYLQSKNIDFVTYEQANINITLNSSKKGLQEQCRSFIDKISDDLNLIETQEHKAEILVEYKQTLNVSNAITTVANRFKAIEEEKKKQEEIQQMSNANISTGMPSTAQEIKNSHENMNTYTFKITATSNQIESLKNYMKTNSIMFERSF